MNQLPNGSEKRANTSANKLLPASLNIPPIRSQANSSADETIIYAKLFMGSWTWLIAEYDPAEQEAFGYAYDASFTDGAEWGYIPIAELEALFQDLTLSDVTTDRTVLVPNAIGVERDKWWKPCSFSEAKRKERFWPWDEEEHDIEQLQTATPEPTPPTKPQVASAYLDPDLLEEDEPEADSEAVVEPTPPILTMARWHEGLQQHLAELATQPSGLKRDELWAWLTV